MQEGRERRRALENEEGKRQLNQLKRRTCNTVPMHNLGASGTQETDKMTKGVHEGEEKERFTYNACDGHARHKQHDDRTTAVAQGYRGGRSTARQG